MHRFTGKAATVDLKIRYEPQVFDLVIEHAPTGTKVLAKGKPSLPKLEGEMNITHAGKSVFDGYGMIDIASYELAGTSNSGDKKVTANAKFDTKNRKFWVSKNFSLLIVFSADTIFNFSSFSVKCPKQRCFNE